MTGMRVLLVTIGALSCVFSAVDAWRDAEDADILVKRGAVRGLSSRLTELLMASDDEETEAIDEFVDEFLDDDVGDADENDDDDSDEQNDGALRYKPWTIRSRRSSLSSAFTVYTLDLHLPGRVFVRALPSQYTKEGDHTVLAKIFVVGASPELVNLVDVALTSVKEASALRVGLETTDHKPHGALTGNLLVEVFLNTQVFSVRSMRVGSSAQVVVDKSVFRNSYGSQPFAFSTVDHAQLFLDVDRQSFYLSSMAFTAQNASTLVMTSTNTLQGSSAVTMQQEGSGALVINANHLDTSQLKASVLNNGGVICMKATSSMQASTINAQVLGAAGGAIEIRGNGQCSSETLTLEGTGSVLTPGIKCSAVIGSLEDSSSALVNPTYSFEYKGSQFARVAYADRRPTVMFGMPGRSFRGSPTLDPSFAQEDASHSVCGKLLASSVIQSPAERVTVVTIAATAPDFPPPVNVSTQGQREDSSANGSVHMLGLNAVQASILVFLASAWMLHYLLQCCDRRQRRQTYRSITGSTDDAPVYV
ncbi:hypothetical protein Poli38472_010911 [Pythium oligandrum]|uniref:Auto-transporter adhesin head GIN domain-containing protein n=1 Tax=Pythium oligandrum TaxID=41045 RepID=A0A8K1CF30_PYTOL|nr:hypothetical protein Poli38472_010911 [Pythium oligandrum]|eukprot:TMW61848.1 hypothetical protein Poli38472_010911 [Pythium oligandrum]